MRLRQWSIQIHTLKPKGNKQMKLLDIMKKYDRCVVRESAKLTKIYNILLKESENAEDIEEAEVCPDCGNDPCTCESDAEDVEEAEDAISAEEFFAEAEKAKKEEATNECGESEDVTESEDKEDVEESEDSKESEDKENVEESEDIEKSEDDEKKLEESLKSYRRANHRLFND